MQISKELVEELQNRLKVGNRRGVHLNGVPGRSRYKFDLCRLRHINERLPEKFVTELLSNCPLKFNISWKDNVPDLNDLFEEEQTQLVKITRAFENLINQTQAIESEKGINTFGFGFPLLVRRDKSDNKLTIAPLFIWSLNIRKLKEFNTWQVSRNEDDAVYLNEVLINHLISDSEIDIRDTVGETLEDGLLDRNELIEVCEGVVNKINGTSKDFQGSFSEKLSELREIPLKTEFEKLPLTYNNSFIHFGGLFSIFEVQKQSVIKDYEHLKELEGKVLNLEDLDNYEFQSISSVETDPTQQAVLNSLQNKRHLLIQGPPGTGKSQSLTAVLINALENGKKCIVVCEKRTALEVLEESLKKKGLDKLTILLKDLVKDRRRVVDSVRNRVEIRPEARWGMRHIDSSRIALKASQSRIKDIVYRINNKHNKLSEKLIGGRNWTQIVGDYLTSYKETDESIEFDPKIFEFTSDELNRYLNKIEKGGALYFEYQKIKSLSFLNSGKLKGDNAFEIEDQMHADFSKYKKEVIVLSELNERFKQEFSYLYIEKFNSLFEIFAHVDQELEKLTDSLINIEKKSKEKYLEKRSDWYRKQVDEIKELCDETQNLIARNLNNPKFSVEGINSFGFRLLLPFSQKNKRTKDDFDRFFALMSKINEQSNQLKGLRCKFLMTNYAYEAQTRIADIESCLDNSDVSGIAASEFDELKFELYRTSSLTKYRSTISNWTFDPDFKSDFLKELEVIDADFTKQFNSIKEEIKAYHEDLDLILKGSIEDRINQIRIFKEELEKKKRQLPEIVDALTLKLNTFTINDQFVNETSTQLNNDLESLRDQIKEDNWVLKMLIRLKDSDEDINKLEEFIKLSEEYFNHEDNPFIKEYKWFSFYNSLSRWEKELFDELAKINNWKSAFLKLYFDALLKKHGDLDELFTDDTDHKQFAESRTSLEKQQIDYILNKWQVIQVQNEQRFDRENAINVVNLYNKRSSSRHQRLSLRNIVSKDIDLFTSFFPIILTTPEVCSSLFSNRDEYFDIVLFDEASQLRLEDNLPALLKGKQVIIAGDEHQMPPSNYFSKIFDGDLADESDEEEDEEIRQDDFILSCESLLEFGQELNFEKRYLDFHYRSRHPYLIDFSNSAFYNGRLKPLPNTQDYIPIKYIPVNGVYSDHSNESEAETVLSIIENNIHRLPNGEYPTVGVATFNISQRNLVISKIRERQQLSRYNEFNAKMAELEAAGFFVKNLENIQGDERDVIILSTTYGHDKQGKFAQRFGPINHTKGYKLLNVIVTRAKYKVYVCTSVPENIFLNYNDYIVAEGSNNRRGVFFAYLAYAKGISERNETLRKEILDNLQNNSKSQVEYNEEIFNLESPFEEEVYQYLIDKYSAQRITTQLEFAGFRIDMVYTPEDPSKKRIAIECDGAAYHSSREAYLYDHHRQKVLEQHGFVFHRIWSTNWWRNPKREAEKLFSFIDNHEVNVETVNQLDSSFTNAFTDDISINSVISHSPQLIQESKSFASTHEEDQEIIFEIDPSNKVKVGDTIEVKYLNSDSILEIKITDKESKKLGEVNLINIKTPLAVAILGKVEGDVVKVGALDKYVEILKIV